MTRLRRFREAGELVTRMTQGGCKNPPGETVLTAERQRFENPVGVAGRQLGVLAQSAPAFGVLGGQEVAPPGVRAHDFAGAGHFEPFDRRFPSFVHCASHRFGNAKTPFSS